MFAAQTWRIAWIACFLPPRLLSLARSRPAPPYQVALKAEPAPPRPARRNHTAGQEKHYPHSSPEGCYSRYAAGKQRGAAQPSETRPAGRNIGTLRRLRVHRPGRRGEAQAEEVGRKRKSARLRATEGARPQSPAPPPALQHRGTVKALGRPEGSKGLTASRRAGRGCSAARPAHGCTAQVAWRREIGEQVGGKAAPGRSRHARRSDVIALVCLRTPCRGM